MKKVRLTTIMVMAFLSLSAMSCKDVKKETTHDDSMHSEMNHDKMGTSNDMMDFRYAKFRCTKSSGRLYGT